MSRSSFKGPLAGPLITLRIPVQVALAAGQASTVLGRIPMPADFRVCSVAFAGLGITANATLAVTNNGGVAGTGTVDIDAASSYLKNYGTDFTSFSQVAKGNALELRGTTDGTGAIPLGGGCAWVTGFFERHIAYGRMAVSGQGGPTGPVAGFYDLLTLTNLRQNANQATRGECDLLAPYTGRIMAISYDLRGHTETTGTINAHVSNATAALNVHNPLDVDVNEQAIVDNLSTPAFLGSANRNFSRGDTLRLNLGTGLNDVVPVGALSAHVLVWVQGLPDNSGVVASDPNYAAYTRGSRGLIGPASGSMICVPLCNKRAAQAANRSEDYFFSPVPLYDVAEIHTKVSSNATVRGLAKSGAPVGSAFSTQHYIAHNEGNAFPSPGSWSAAVVGGSVAGEDAATRYFAAADSMTLDCSTVAAAALNVAGYALCAVRGHRYDDPAND